MDSKQLKFDRSYLRMAQVWAENSYCNRRKVGALIVKDKMIISDGYNGTPPDLKMSAKMRMGIQNRMCSTQRPMQLQRWQNQTIPAMAQRYM